ncbi:adenomatous polyposis coli protein-like isoform X2 [Prorops nasuta]|uniref:adenomatous polyposis coli protein-like isoform X2 n=1 Tax=Prorops nasuta TaxID=863751 RepID=UPI0034CDD04E
MNTGMDKKTSDVDDIFGDYTETDLDQPTDYSLRYAEDDTDDDSKQSCDYFRGSVEDDTIKMYCTEGTPYETPFNFSTATSMSDLRIEDGKDTDHLKKISKKESEAVRKENDTFKAPTHLCDKQENLLIEKEKSEAVVIDFNSGLITPEKPVNYYEEGTPGSFSRVNSLSSLNSAIVPPSNDSDHITKTALSNPRNVIESEAAIENDLLGDSESVVASRSSSLIDTKSSARATDKEGKMVTFETPLMFSRCSSLGSLSGFEQHSIHDDRSSIVSDFSRRTSGIISPSELPDSPTQTIPPSPRNNKTQLIDYTNKTQEQARRPTPHRNIFYNKPEPIKNSVFEDDIATFKEESTPLEFSTTTSLSSLTIDDEPKVSTGCKAQNKNVKVPEPLLKNIEKEESNIKMTDTEKEQDQVSDGDEDDEDMLAACISMGMQNNRYRQSFKTLISEKSTTRSEHLTNFSHQRNIGINRIEPRLPIVSVELVADSALRREPRAIRRDNEAAAASDTVCVYCTEDTPVDISPVGSHSNLSALSMPSIQEDIEYEEQHKPIKLESLRNDLSDDSSNLSGDDEKILNECIQSGIPKARQITPPPVNCITFTKKTEASTQTFNVCGTPSTSPVEVSHSNKNPILIKPICHPIEHDAESSDESPNHSEDEAILTECIQSAMPKARLSVSPSTGPPMQKIADNPKIPINHSPSSSLSTYRSKFRERRPIVQKILEPSEESFSLSEEEEDLILAQCIRSGMPKTLQSSPKTPIPILKKESNHQSIPKSNHGSQSSTSRVIHKNYPNSCIQEQRKLPENRSPRHLVSDVACDFRTLSLNVPDNNLGHVYLKYSREKLSTSTSCARSPTDLDVENSDPNDNAFLGTKLTA